MASNSTLMASHECQTLANLPGIDVDQLSAEQTKVIKRISSYPKLTPEDDDGNNNEHEVLQLKRQMSLGSMIQEKLTDQKPIQAPYPVGVLLLEGNIELQKFKTLVTERISFLQRFSSKPVLEMVKGVKTYHWVTAENFTGEDNVIEVEGLVWEKEDDVAKYASELLLQPFDENIPRWTIHVLRHSNKTQTALVAKFDHALGDGFTIIQFILALTDEGSCSVAPSREPSFSKEIPNHGTESLFLRSSQDAGLSPRPAAHTGWCGVAGTFFGWIATLLKALWLAAAALPRAPREARALGAALWAVVGAVRTPDTKSAICPFGMEKGKRRLFFSKEYDVKALKAAARRAAPGATLGDLLLAAAAGAAGAYLRGRRLLPPPPPRGNTTATFMVSRNYRVEPFTGVIKESAFGNRSNSVVCPVPLHESDPLARLAQVKEDMDKIKGSRLDLAVAILEKFLYSLVVFNEKAGQQSMEDIAGDRYRAFQKHGLLSNVPGPAGPLRLGGLRVAALRGCLAMNNCWTPLSYAGRLSVTYVADRRHVPDGDTLVGLLEAELDGYLRRGE